MSEKPSSSSLSPSFLEIKSQPSLRTRVWQMSSFPLRKIQGGYLELYNDGLVLTFDINNPITILYSDIHRAKVSVGKINLETAEKAYKLYLINVNDYYGKFISGDPAGRSFGGLTKNMDKSRAKLSTQQVCIQIVSILRTHGVKTISRIAFRSKKARLIWWSFMLVLVILIDILSIVGSQQSGGYPKPSIMPEVIIGISFSLIILLVILSIYKSPTSQPTSST